MTVSSETRRWVYDGDGSTTTFAYDNKIFADADLKIYIDDTLQVLNTHYTVTGAGTEAGGNVVFKTTPTDYTPANNTKVTIIRDVAQTQGSDYPVAGAFPAVTTENALDRLTILLQQVQEEVDRCLQFSVTENTHTSAEVLAPETGKVLYWNGLKLGNANLTDLAGNATFSDVSPSYETYSQIRSEASISDGQAAIVLGKDSAGDGAAGIFRAVTGASAGTYTDNGATILVPTGNDGSSAWLREFQGPAKAKWWGVKADNSTEDQVAAQAAISACEANGSLGTSAGPVELQWPTGVILIDANLVPGGTFVWSGVSKTGTQFKAKTSTVTEMVALPDSVLGDTNTTSRSSITGIGFNGNSVATYAIKGYTNHLTIRDCRIVATTTSATDISYGWSCLYDNVEVSSNSGDGITCVGGGSNNDLTIRDCKVFSNSGIGIKIGSSSDKIRIRGCSLEQNAKCGIFATNALDDLEISGCYFESNSNTGFTFTTPAETIKADIILNGAGTTDLGYGTPITNAVIEKCNVASGGGTAFVFAGGMNGGAIRNNTLASGTSRLLQSYGNVSGSLTYGHWSDVDISGNKGFAKTFTGTHDGSSNASALSDTGAFTADYLIGAIVKNTTDGSYGLITDNDANSVTASLTGGSESDWDAGDAYEILVPEVSVLNMPLSGAGSNIDVGGEFADTEFDGAEKINLVQPDFNLWSLIAGGGGTWQRSSTAFAANPNVSVWEISYLSSGTSSRFGFSINMDDYPNLQGKFGIFSIWVKHPFSSDGNVLLYAGGTSDTPTTNNVNTWQRYNSLFRFPVQGSISFGVAKTGASATVQLAAPMLRELGATPLDLSDVFEERYQFRGTAAPTVGTWKDGDTVWNSAPAVGAPAAWTCTTAGTPGTWTAWANL